MKIFKKCLSLIVIIFFVGGFIGCSSNKNFLNPATNAIAQATVQGTASGNISTYFTKANQHPENALIKVINSSKSTLNIAIYSITKYDIVDAIVNAKKRGIDVKIITDKECSSNSSQAKELSYMLKNNIPIKINSHSGLMHMKARIADSSMVTVGSYNYTENASTENDEVLCVINDKTTASTFQNEFNSMWNDTSNYKDYTSGSASNSSNNKKNSSNTYYRSKNKKSYNRNYGQQQ